jgi:hypothetical protein
MEFIATAFQTLTTNYPEYCNRWISDDKWMEIIQNNCIDDPSKEKEEELKFSRANMIRAIGARWKTTIEDFTQTNQFRHRYFVSFEVENDKRGMVAKRRQVTCLYATKPGQDYPRKPRVAEVFKGEDEMDYCIRGLKKRKRAEDEVDKTMSATTNHQASIDYYDTSYWNSGRQKIYLCHWLESRYVTVWIYEYILCVRAIILKLHGLMLLIRTTKMDCANLQRFSKLICQAYIFALDWMNQQNDNDVLNKTWKECCEAACKHLNPCGNLAATTGETIARWNQEFRTINKFLHPNPVVRSGKSPELSLFEHFPESKDLIKRFANGNLADLTI